MYKKLNYLYIYVLTYKYSRASLKTENNTMNEDRFTSQNAWYHFVLDDIKQAIDLYGIDVVMVDIYDRLEETRTQEYEYDQSILKTYSMHQVWLQ